MATHCNIYLRGKRMRVTELDSCGVWTPGVSRSVVTDGFISVELSAEVEDGNEILVRNAAGALCVNEKQADSFKRFNLTVELCGVNPDLLSMTTNAEPYEDYTGDVAGITVAEGEIEKYFALELWLGLSGQACAGGGVEEASGYLLLPFTQGGVPADLSIDGENAVTFGISGASTRGGNQWGVGPYAVLFDDEETPAANVLPTALDDMDHLLLIDTMVPPPAVACDAAELPVNGG